ncbi:MAG: PorT family protein, partial [Treponema sp.]|nr:PorT family protein [Treponema sp.]
MKQRVFFTAALCCVLLFTGFNAVAQETTSPFPPPEEGTSTIPAPADTGAARQPAATTRRPTQQAPAQRPARQTPAQQQQAPAQSGAAQRQAPAGSQQSSASTAAAAQTAQQTGIPSTGRFWGAMAGFGSYGYEYDYNKLSFDLKGDGGFNAGFFLGYDFGLLAAQAEVLFATESAKIQVYNWGYGGYSYYDEFEYSGKNIQVPLMLKLDFHLGRFMLQP